LEALALLMIASNRQQQALPTGLRQEKPASQITPNLLKFAQIQPFATFDNPPHEYAQI
jgi:hypothetical protein